MQMIKFKKLLTNYIKILEFQIKIIIACDIMKSEQYLSVFIKCIQNILKS